MSKVQEVFGKFAVELASGAELFDTRAEAEEALVIYTKAAEHNKLAEDYCAARGFTDRNKVGKSNVVTDFLLWVDTRDQPGDDAEAPEAETTVQGTTQF